METVFKEKSADIKFHDVQGKNYRCAIPNLNKEIVPEKSKVVVKPNKVIITLFKASKGNWLDLHSKEDKVISNLKVSSFNAKMERLENIDISCLSLWVFVLSSSLGYQISVCDFAVQTQFGQGEGSNGRNYGFDEGQLSF